MSIDHHLATYGSLSPGQCNHHELAGLSGEWRTGMVTGRLIEKGWGADLGYPAIILTEDGDPVPVNLFVSTDLPDHWARLDDFEGDGYRRVVVTVRTGAGSVEAWIYADAGSGGADT